MLKVGDRVMLLSNVQPPAWKHLLGSVQSGEEREVVVRLDCDHMRNYRFNRRHLAQLPEPR